MIYALLLALMVPLQAVSHGVGTPTPAATATPEPTPVPGTIAGHVTLLDKESPRPGEGGVVYLEQVDPALFKSRSKRPTPRLSMVAKKFVPRVVAVVAGEPVDFPNSDPVFHNVFSLSGKNKFDLGLYKDGASKKRRFENTGVVRVYCNIHPWMTAYVLVLQNPWYASVGATGTYQIEDVPPGSYTLHAWDEKGGESTRPVTVEAGAKTIADFEIDARAYKELPHKNKRGQDYGKTTPY